VEQVVVVMQQVQQEQQEQLILVAEVVEDWDRQAEPAVQESLS